MDRTNPRAWRRIQEHRVWRNRLKYYANLHYQVKNPDTGRWEEVTDWRQLRRERWMLKLKDTATVCSCWMCRNYLYDRPAYRRDAARLLRDQLADSQPTKLL